MISKLYSITIVDGDGNTYPAEFTAEFNRGEAEPLTLVLRSDVTDLDIAAGLTETDFQELVAYVREVIETGGQDAKDQTV